MTWDILVTLAISLANSPYLCEQATYDRMYSTLTQIDFRLADKGREIENSCTTKLKTQCRYTSDQKATLEFIRTFKFNSVMALRKKCNGMRSTYEKLK